MRKRFFDVGLYADALRQLRLIGIAAFVVLELEAILLPLANWFSRQQMPTCSNGTRWFCCALS